MAKFIMPPECCGRCRYYSTARGMKANGYCLKHRRSEKAKHKYPCLELEDKEKKFYY